MRKKTKKKTSSRKRILFILCVGVVLLLIFGTVALTNPIIIDTELEKDEIAVQKGRLYQDILFLTSISPSRNSQNADSLNTAASYIYNEFEKAGCAVDIRDFT